MAMSTEDRIAAGKQAVAYKAALAANNGIDPALTAQYGITDPDLAKYLQMVSMPATIAWGAPSAGGSRSQEQAAARAKIAFEQMGGQAELDRIQAKIQSTPALKSQLASVTAAGNKGDMFSRIGDAVVAATPTALKLAAAYATGDALGLMSFPGSTATTGSSALSSAVPSTVAADPIAAMTGAGTGVSDLAALNSAMSAPGAMMSGSIGNAATGLGYDMLGTAATGAGVAGGTTELQTILQQAAQAGVSPEVLQQAATNPSILEQVKQVVNGPGTGTRTSWMDYLSTGLGLVQGINQVTGGNSLDTNAIRSMVDPFAPYRSQYAGQLNQLMSTPSSVTTLPGYQFLQQQGQQGVQRALAAQGRTGSGQELLALQEQDQGLANKFYNDQFQKLAMLSGASSSPSTGGEAGVKTMGTNAANQQAGWRQLGTLAAGAMTPNTPISRTVDSISNLWR